MFKHDVIDFSITILLRGMILMLTDINETYQYNCYELILTSHAGASVVQWSLAGLLANKQVDRSILRQGDDSYQISSQSPRLSPAHYNLTVLKDHPRYGFIGCPQQMPVRIPCRSITLHCD